MKIGALTAAWSNLPLEKVLDFFCESGLQAVEIGSGNYPGNAHCDPDALNKSAAKRKALLKAVESRDMVISALSCHGNPLHPNAKVAKENHEVFRATVTLAEKLGVTCVNGFSGLPGGAPGDKVPNWVVAPWPEDHLAALEYQWKVATKYWKAENKFLHTHGVDMCFEMHPNFLVYNPESLIKLRKACGDRMCCNFDPSHLFWQGIDNTAAIRWLSEKGDVIKHVHAKDIAFEQSAEERGEVTGTAVGCACGEGAVDWPRVIEILRAHGYKGALSVECGTIDQAERSLAYLQSVV